MKPLVSLTVPAWEQQALWDLIHTNSQAPACSPSLLTHTHTHTHAHTHTHTHTHTHAHTYTHKQQCMAVLLELFTLSRRPSVRQRNEWLFILEGWFNELDPQLLCVSTRRIQTRPSPVLTPPYALHKVREGDTLIASFGTGESGRPTAPL